MAEGKARKKSAAVKKPAAKAPAKKKKAKTSAASKKPAPETSQAEPGQPPESNSLMDQIIGLTSQLTSGAVEIARSSKAIPLMFTDNWVKDAYMKTLEPEQLQAMIDAGSFLKDAREVAGLNIAELAEAVGLSDSELLEEVEEGRATLPFDMILRIASLIARHDPIPFIIKFLRTYNPELEQTLEQWGIMKLPKQYERERRFINIYRSQDKLRELSDAEFERFIGYMNSATDFTLDIMMAEKQQRRRGGKKKPAS